MVVYLARTRLGGIDRMLPVLMEIRKIHPKRRIIIVFISKEQYHNVRLNGGLWGAMTAIGAEPYVLGKSVVKLILFILKLVLKKVTLIRDRDNLPKHNITMAILKTICVLTDIKAYILIQFESYYNRLNIQGSPRHLKVDYDYFMSVIPFNMPRRIPVGFVYGLPEWQKYIKKRIEDNRFIKDDYIFYILHATHLRRPGEMDQSVLLEETLSALRRLNIKTIFKPHSITNLNEVRRIIQRVGYDNYMFDYSHPYVLSSGAKFVISNASSSIFFMSIYQSTPTIEYSDYGEELFKKLKGPVIGKYCNFFIRRDPQKLYNIAKDLIGGKKVKQDLGDFRNTPKEFYDFWRGV